MQPSGLRGLYLFSLLTFVLVLVLFVMSLMQHFGGPKTANQKNIGGFFDSQNAMLVGTVTAVKDNSITVQNKKGMKQDLPVSKTVMIMGKNGVATPPTPGQADLKSIELNKEYSIALIANEGVLEVNSIMPTAPASAPAAAPLPSTRANPATNSAVPNPVVSAPPAPSATARP